jgi:hypothetical protein
MWWKVTINGKICCQEADSSDAAVFGAMRRDNFGYYDRTYKGIITYERIGRPRNMSKRLFKEVIEKTTTG